MQPLKLVDMKPSPTLSGELSSTIKNKQIDEKRKIAHSGLSFTSRNRKQQHREQHLSTHAKATDSLVTALEEQKKAIGEMPQRIKVNVEHRLTGWQRPYIITGIVLVVVTVFSLFASFQLWRSNSAALQDGDIKIRMVRLFYPDVSMDIDSIYNSNPKELKIWVKQEEERLLAIRKAEENAKQSTEQAERAKEELERLKER